MNIKKVIFCIVIGIVVGVSLGIIGKLLEINPSAILFIVMIAGAVVGGVVGSSHVKAKSGLIRS